MDKRALRYSLDQKISEIKEWKSFDIETKNLEDRMQTNNVQSIVQENPDFHYKFDLIKNPPYIIYYMGNISLLNRNILWIVWPRKKTIYADHIIQVLLKKASHYQLSTISGMALGVDQLCHTLSIKNDIPTIAVLGWWMRRFLKSWDRHLIQKIVENGWLILSEFKIDFQPTFYSFPQRNRIIAGLCDTLFLPQAWKKSWSLITVDFALEKNKPVFAVADNFFSPESQWVHQYISDKKINMLTNIDTYLSQYFSPQLWISSVNPDITLSENEKIIFNMISKNSPITLQKICTLSNMYYQQVLSTITLLEIKSLIYQSSPWIYQTGFYPQN
jgi:DNA processing protein